AGPVQPGPPGVKKSRECRWSWEPRSAGAGAEQLQDVAFERLGPPLGAVFVQDAMTGPPCDAAPLCVGHVEGREHLGGRAHDLQLAADRKELVEPRPPIAEDRRPAGGGLE